MEKMIDKDFPKGLLTQAAELPSLRVIMTYVI